MEKLAAIELFKTLCKTDECIEQRNAANNQQQTSKFEIFNQKEKTSIKVYDLPDLKYQMAVIKLIASDSPNSAGKQMVYYIDLTGQEYEDLNSYFLSQ